LGLIEGSIVSLVKVVVLLQIVVHGLYVDMVTAGFRKWFVAVERQTADRSFAIEWAIRRRSLLM